jgi:hypothetical protein
MVSMNEMAEIVLSFENKQLPIHHIPGPEGVRGRNSDNTLIKEKLGWAPTMRLKVLYQISHVPSFQSLNSHLHNLIIRCTEPNLACRMGWGSPTSGSRSSLRRRRLRAWICRYTDHPRSCRPRPRFSLAPFVPLMARSELRLRASQLPEAQTTWYTSIHSGFSFHDL